MQNQQTSSNANTPDEKPDTVGPTETEMPDATAIDQRIQSGELKQDAEAAFGGQDDGDSS